ncbi:protein kinase domain-containing protein [Nocardia xishanensis]
MLARAPRTARAIGRLAPAGRMAASNYIGQSIVLMVLYTRYGFALAGEVPPVGVFGLALLTYAAQLALSAWWLRDRRTSPTGPGRGCRRLRHGRASAYPGRYRRGMSGQRGSGSFGSYHLERLLGRGGMGEVWLARDGSGGAVALKVLSTSYSADSAYRRRFEREARLGVQLRNPHIVPIHHFGEVEGHLFLEMAYIEGVDLATRLLSGPLAPHRAVEVIAQAAEALDAAHVAGLVHRDVKPANILEHTSGFVYLIDFGIARGADATALTAAGQVVGTLQYMAPERFEGTLDARSDIYSLACVLYETLTGRLPYGDGGPAQQMRAHLTATPPPASRAAAGVPAALDAVIARGMAKDPRDRYATAGEFAAAARAALGLPVQARRPPPMPRQVAPGTRPATRVMTAAGPPVSAAVSRPAATESRPLAPTDRRPRPSMSRWAAFAAAAVAVAAVALWLLVGGIDIGSQPGSNPTTPEVAAPAPNTTTSEGAAAATTGALPPPTAGQPSDAGGAVRDGNFAFTVTDTVSGVPGTGSADGSSTVVTLTVTNVSDRRQVFPVADQRLITAGGRSVAPEAAAATAGLNPSGTGSIVLDPGGTGTIRLAFDLSGKDKKNDKKSDKKQDVPSHLELHGGPSTSGVIVPIR